MILYFAPFYSLIEILINLDLDRKFINLDLDLILDLDVNLWIA